jgi:hypothetical protein
MVVIGERKSEFQSNGSHFAPPAPTGGLGSPNFCQKPENVAFRSMLTLRREGSAVPNSARGIDGGHRRSTEVVLNEQVQSPADSLSTGGRTGQAGAGDEDSRRPGPLTSSPGVAASSADAWPVSCRQDQATRVDRVHDSGFGRAAHVASRARRRSRRLAGGRLAQSSPDRGRGGPALLEGWPGRLRPDHGPHGLPYT